MSTHAGVLRTMEVNEMVMEQGTRIGGQGQAGPARARFLRIKVLDERGHASVNVRLPIGMVTFGMKMAQTFSPKVRDADLDWGAITAMIEDGAQGEIVHVEDEKEHTTVEVWVE